MSKTTKYYFLYFSLLLLLPGYSQESSINSFNVTIDGKSVSSAEALSLYIQQKSHSCEEKNAGEWLKNVCVENGLNTYQFGNENGNYNFAASLFPLSDSLPNIIFLNHIDAVHEGDSNLWTYPPYSGHISDFEVWGRGAFDNKGPAIMQLWSVLQFKSLYSNQKLPYNVTFLAVSCEETMCDGGVKYVLENHLSDLNPVTVIGEGATELNTLLEFNSNHQMFGISIAHKRPLWIELSLDLPTAGHSSVTPLEYANKEMVVALANLLDKKSKFIFIPENVSILKHLGEEQKGIKKFLLKHPRFFKPLILSSIRKEPELAALFNNTITVTSLNSNNNVINKTSQGIKVNVDCRLMPEYSKSKFLKSMQKALKNDDIQITIISEMPPAPISRSNNDFYLHLESAVLEAYPEAHVFPILLPNFNDVGWFRNYGIEGFSIIPVILEMEQLMSVHSVNERLPIEALKQGSQVYFYFLKNACTH